MKLSSTSATLSVVSTELSADPSSNARYFTHHSGILREIIMETILLFHQDQPETPGEPCVLDECPETYAPEPKDLPREILQ